VGRRKKWVRLYDIGWTTGWMPFRPKHIRIGSTGDPTYEDHHFYWLGFFVCWEVKGGP